MKKITSFGAALATIAALQGWGSPREGLAQTPAAPQAREVEVVVEGAYRPNRIEVDAGAHVRLRFVRRTWSGCVREVVFPTLGIRRALPVDRPVLVEFDAPARGEVPFHCGMNMLRGVVVVRPSP